MNVNDDDVADPAPFPNPVIVDSQITSVNVRINNNIVRREALVSDSGNIYEIGRSLKSAIFGEVLHAVLLLSAESQESVYRRSDQHIAIKRISRDEVRRGGRIENPMEEIRALQYLSGENRHDHVSSQIECCQDRENVYSIMEFYRGSELFSYIANNQVTEADARIMFQQIVRGLSHLHQLGIAHRDLSPENIMLHRDNMHSTIIDFGQCVQLRRIPESRQRNDRRFYRILNTNVHGKNNYVAPEVMQNDLQPYDPMLSDIWSLGAILYTTLTRSPPVESPLPVDPCYQLIVKGRLRELLKILRLEMDEDAADLCQKIFREDPDARISLEEIQQHPWMQR